MKNWIRITGEDCPKCNIGYIEAYSNPDENFWRGGESLRCTEPDCNVKGKIVLKEGVGTTEYETIKEIGGC